MSGMPVFRLSAPLAAFLALLLLAPGAARAVNDCGALNAGNTFTENCPDAAYTGIVYWDQPNAVTLTVPGTATTTTITAGANNGLHNGITIRTNDDTTSPRTSAIRNIALTVGSAAGAVAIVQSGTRTSSWYNNRGILVLQRDGGGATTMVDVKSGVTIGTATDKMENGGIEVVVTESDAGTVTVTSGAAIYSEADGDRPGGIHIGNAGSGAVTLTNSGAIVSDARGINVEDTGSAGAVTITSSGAVTSAATTALEGIRAVSTGKDAANTVAGVSITHSSGAVSVAGGVGIRAHVGASRQEADTAHGDYVMPMNAGLAKVAVTGGSVTSKGHAVEAVNFEAGSVEVMVAAGVTATSTEGRGIDAVLRDVGNTAGTVSVTSAGAVTADAASGIHARNAAGNAGAVTVAVTGGSVTTKGTRAHAVEALQEGTGDAVVDVSDGAAITSKQNAGILAQLRLAGNDEGQVKVTQGGTIAGRTGVHAYVSRDSASGGETRAAADQPLIDVTWTGSFSHGTTATVAQDDSDRWVASDATLALTHHRTVEAGKYDRGDDAGKGTRYGTPAGIEAQVMSWNDVAARVAEADDPGMIADNAAQMALLAETGAGSQRTAILAAFKAALGNGAIDVADGVFDAVKTGETSLDDVTDAEIVTYLSTDDADTRTLLRNVLKYSLSEAEMAVLRAAATNDGLTDAVLDAALPSDATDGEKMTYRTEVRAFLRDFNVGDIRVSMTGGSIDSRGDGIRAYYATPNAVNGAISVTIAAGATVTGDVAGVYVANAGSTGTGAARILKQTVTVNGMVTGGSDAAVHLSGGGTLTVGETGKVHAGSSGVAILVNDPGRSEIVINGEVKGGAGGDAAVRMSGGGTVTIGVNGRVEANGATYAIKADGGGTAVTLRAEVDTTRAAYREEAIEVLAARVDGKVDGVGDNVVLLSVDDAGRTGMATTVSVADDGTLDPSGLTPRPTRTPTEMPEPSDRTMLCDDASDNRCRLYNALPSALLSMNGLPSYGERMASARSAGGGWALVEAASGKWKASRSPTDASVSYNRSRTGVRAGVDMAVGEGGRVGLSAHGLTGSAKMSGNGGKVGVTGVGLGANATTRSADGFYLDAQLAVTQYRTKLTSQDAMTLKSGVKGTGYALALETGQSMAMGGDVSVTPRAGLAWSRVSLGKFMDTRGRGTPVEMKPAGSFTAAVGLGVESAPAGGPVLFGTLDVVQEFTRKTKTQVLDRVLESTAPGTSLRIGLGAAADLGDGASLRGSVGYETAGGGTNEFAGGLSLTASF